MKSPESIVTSLEISKQLKEAGCEQKSLLYFCVSVVNGYVNYDLHMVKPVPGAYKEYISAYTSDELGEMLPGLIVKENGEHLFWDSFKTNEGKWTIKWNDTEEIGLIVKGFISQQKEADARGLMWLYLKQNGLLEGGKV